jgi:transketolase
VVRGVDGHDPESIRKAIEEARSVKDKPSLICCRTVIGYGAPNLAGTHDCHGAPLGEDEIAATRDNIGWSHPPFVVPDEIYAGWNARDKGARAEQEWNARFAAYKKAHPELAAEFERRMAGKLPDNWDAKAAEFIAAVDKKSETIASRKASQNALNGYGPMLPELLGGSADLAGSNLTLWSGSKDINKGNGGNYIYYGVREFGMSAIMNGIALHGGFIPYGATFLMFSEYARNALRMAALMRVHSIFVYTHDSIGLGEDGPTHQAVEQTATLRLIPRMSVWRPCDAVESAVAWKAAIDRTGGPSCLIFSRQNLKHMTRTAGQIEAIRRGGYVLSDCAGTPEAVIIGTGSEVGLAMDAAKALTEKGRKVRVISMPSTDVFDAQDAAYRESVLPSGVATRVAVEAGITDYWRKYVGLNGKVVGLDTFGESAPADQVYKHFGITADSVVKAVESLL